MVYGDYAGYFDDVINDTCPGEYQLFTIDTMAVWTFYLGVAASCIIAVFNVLVVVMFLKSKLLTPASVFFISLAITDTLSSFCQSVPISVAFLSSYLENPGNELTKVKYEICSFLVITEGPFYYAFHDASILVTTFLGISKVVAMKFPIWFRINVNIKIPLICSIVALMFALCLELYPVFEFSVLSDEDGWCCSNLALTDYYFKFSIVGQWVVPLLYLVAVTVLVICASYVASKLTCCRSMFDKTKMSEVAKRRNRQSAINFVLVTVVLVITEAIDIVCILSPIMTTVFGLPDVFQYEAYRNVFRYSRVFITVGFASNFVIYLISSKSHRDLLKNMFTCKELQKHK